MPVTVADPPDDDPRPLGLDPLELAGSVVDNTDVAVIAKDLDGIIVFWNPGAEQLYGWPEAEIIGRPIATIIPHDRIDEWRRYLGAALTGRRTSHFETVRRHRDGHLIEVSLTISPVRDHTGEIVGASAMARDNRAERQLRRELLERQAAVDRLFERERFLADASAALAQSLDHRTTLSKVAELCVPVLGDMCSIDLVNDGRIEHVELVHRDPEVTAQATQLVRRFSPFPASAVGTPRVVVTGEAELFPRITAEMIEAGVRDPDAVEAVKSLGIRSAMIVPMRVHGTSVGAITLVVTDSATAYDREDVEIAQRLADRAGVAVDNARQWMQRIDAEERLRASEAKFRTLADSQRALIWSAGKDGRRTYFSEGWLAFTGRELQEELDWGWLDEVHPDDREALRSRIVEATGEEHGYEAEYRLRRADGQYRWMLERCRPRYPLDDEALPGHTGGVQVRGYVGSCVDITDRKLTERELAWQATHDELTGLANRNYAYRRLSELVRELQRHEGVLALLYVDVDGLKTINDEQGHASGDEHLRRVARDLEAACRPDDLLARIGGDEFLIAVPRLEDASEARAVAERLLSTDRDAAEPGESGVADSSVSLSIGIALTDDEATRVEDLIDHADEAMYVAKRSGGACYRFADRAVQDREADRKELASRLLVAARSGALSEHWSPVVDLETGEQVMLCQHTGWWAPDGQLVEGETLLAWADRLGVGDAVRDRALQDALSVAERSREQRPDAPLSVLTPMDPDRLSPDALISTLTGCLGRPGCRPGDLVLAVPEQSFERDGRVTDRVLGPLRQAGVSLALADVGSGGVSVRSLRDFPGRYLVLSSGLAVAATRDAEDRALLAATVRAGSDLGYTVIAPAADSDERRDALRELGCRFGIGGAA